MNASDECLMWSADLVEKSADHEWGERDMKNSKLMDDYDKYFLCLPLSSIFIDHFRGVSGYCQQYFIDEH